MKLTLVLSALVAAVAAQTDSTTCSNSAEFNKCMESLQGSIAKDCGTDSTLTPTEKIAKCLCPTYSRTIYCIQTTCSGDAAKQLETTFTTMIEGACGKDWKAKYGNAAASLKISPALFIALGLTSFLF